MVRNINIPLYLREVDVRLNEFVAFELRRVLTELFVRWSAVPEELSLGCGSELEALEGCMFRLGAGRSGAGLEGLLLGLPDVACRGLVGAFRMCVIKLSMNRESLEVLPVKFLLCAAEGARVARTIAASKSR